MPSTLPTFDHIARPYRWLEYLTLGPLLQQTRTYFLPRLDSQRSALVLGDGDGRFLVQLLTRNPRLYADAVDTSAVMLKLLRQRCEAASPNISTRLITHHTNALLFPAVVSHPGKYDLVITHFFLDCLTQLELESLILRIIPTLAPGALWLVSDFRVPTGPMHLPAKIFIRSLYFAFRILTGLRTTHLPNHATPLTQAGLTRIARHDHLAGLLTTELWQIPE